MQIEINDIKVKRRIRKDLLDITELAESMKRIGLLTPITINQHNILIAGQRRLEAAKLLNWKTIEAHIIQTENEAAAFEMEIEENIQRVQFTDEELFRAFSRLNTLQHPGIFARIWNAIIIFVKKLFKR